MSRRKRKKSKSAGNIRAEATYDPFPKSGLVKQYEPFIRREVGEFLNQTTFRLSALRLRDADWVGKLSDTIAAGHTQESPDITLIDAINAERPFLSLHQRATADWMLGLHSGTDRRSLVQFADDQGVSKGYASKLRDQALRGLGSDSKKFVRMGNLRLLPCHIEAEGW